MIKTLQLVAICIVAAIRSDAVGSEQDPLVHEGIVDAPVEIVWSAMTTKEGLESWMVPHAEIDLRVGGKMMTNYHADGVIGDKHTIENTILSFEPNRMLSLKATKPPANFPFKQAIENTWSVMYFEPDGPERTRVRTVGMGYGTDEESQRMRAFFDKGNDWTIMQLQQKFARKERRSSSTHRPAPATSRLESNAEKVLQLLGRWVGGEWIHEVMREDGSVFRVRNVIERGPDGKCLVATSWLGDATGMFHHGNTQIWREPGTDEVRYQNVNEHGAIARGDIRLEAPDSLVWNWDTKSHGKDDTHFRVRTVFNCQDTYRMHLLGRTDDSGEYVLLMDIELSRVDRAPERFTKLRADNRRPSH